ncbi:MAG: TonB-dependent receptor [Myxococcota bacterium]|nr:TonB-dependent receptor [Myxococcota bacterium]
MRRATSRLAWAVLAISGLALANPPRSLLDSSPGAALTADAGTAVESGGSPHEEGPPPGASSSLPADGPTPTSEDEAPSLQTVITASRSPQRAEDLTIPTEVISRREIEVSGARDLAELLEQHPGVEIARESPVRTSGVRLLGLDPEYVLLLIDGQRVAGRVGGTIDLERFSLREVERIEIVKGPASVLYGSDAMGGVINLITRRTRRPLEAEARASYGGRGESDLRAGAGVSGSRWNLGAGAIHRRGEAFDLDPSTVATTGSALSSWDVELTGEARPVDGALIDLRLHYQRRDTGGVDAAPSGAIFDRRNRGEVYGATLHGRLEHTPLGTLSLRGAASGFRDQFQQDQRLARDLDLYQESKEGVVEAGLQLDQNLFERHQASVGVDGLMETLRSPRLGAGYGRRFRGAVFVQDDWRPLDEPRVHASAGVRMDLDSQFGPSVSPRIAFRYDPWRGLALRGSLGWGFRAPSFQELLLNFENPGIGYVVEGNPALRPERSRGINLSADWTASDRLTVSGSAFRTDLDDLIALITVQEATPDTPLRFGYRNVSRGYTQGVELAVRTKLGSFLSVDLGYALTDARDAESGAPLEGRAMHRGTVRLTGRLRQWNLDGSLGASLVGPRPFLDPASAGGFRYSAPYANVDARVGWRPWPFLGVFAFATNLLDSGNVVDLPLAPRGFHAGVEGRL